MKAEKKIRIEDEKGDDLGHLISGPPPASIIAQVEAIEAAISSMEARVTVHPDRASWLKARAAGIGGSEAALVLDAAPSWGSPYKLWAEKTGLVQRDDDDNEVFRFGRLMEPHIADEYTRLTGRQLVHLGDWAIRQHPSIACMFATHDRIIAPIDARGPGILSIKTANVWKGIEWLDHEEAPLPYQIQFQQELACSGYAWGSYAVMIWGKGVRWVDAERNDKFIALLERENQAFWNRVVTGEAPPIDGSDHTTEALRRLYPKDSGEVVVLPAEAAQWATEIEACDVTLKATETRKKQLNNLVREALGTASEGYVPGGPRWTNRLQSRKESVTSASEFRVLRRKGAKGSEAA